VPFEWVRQSDHLVLKLSGDCTGEEKPSPADTFAAHQKETGAKHVIVQCVDCGHISGNFLRELLAIYKSLKSMNGQIRLVGASESVQGFLKSNGVDRVLIHKLSMKGALADFGLAKSRDIDVNFINPFLNATVKVFKIQCFVELKAKKPYLKSTSDPALLGDVSGIISITSETFAGTLAISMSDTIFLRIAKNMLGEDAAAINETNVDLIGELANMILGQAKVELSSLGYRVEMALPSCVWGKEHKIKHFGSGKCMVLPFETEWGMIYSEIMSHSSASERSAA
jgi:chemotaxis protein CheX